jgi:uncharacterized protein (TIGR03435 family)
MLQRVLFTFICVHSWPAFGQSFEAASIKPNNSGSFSSHGHTDNGGVRLENYSLKQLIQQAYDVKDYAFTGPSWLEDTRFDIVARTPEATKGNQLQLMMQSLLAERFGLKVHREPKSVAGYALVAGKKPPVLHERAAGTGSNTNSNNGKMEGTNVSMDRLADILARMIRQPVQDQTGLAGVMDIKLEWTPDQADPTTDGPGSIFTALEEQVGFKLQAKKITIDALVVDHIERTPTDN